MPIRAYCTICSDFFDHSKDVAAIHCGHTFHYDCLLQWFQTAPTKTCPQCRKQVSTRHIINKLFFDIGGEEDGKVDPDCLQVNNVDNRKLRSRTWQEKQKIIDGLRDTVDKQKKDMDSLRKDAMEKDMLCAALRKQMTYLETQQNDIQSAKEEAKRLRIKLKTFESLDILLQGQRSEVESMISDMGMSQAAVEQLSIYCISLKKEYDNLKGSLKSSNEMCEKLKREVLSTNNKVSLYVNQTKEDIKALHKDLSAADKEISSLKKKIVVLQNTLSTPTRTNEALSRLVFESPAPLELKHPQLHRPSDSQDIDLNMTYDITTPEDVSKKPSQVLSKKMRLDPLSTSLNKAIEDDSMDPFLKNSLLFRKKTFGSMLDPQKYHNGAVRSGYDGLGGRTKFIQPSPLAEIRPLIKAKRKKVSRPVPKISPCLTLDNFLE
uniref:RING-type domain-containing protein n=1 Tax=Periophthalmus magnuspinnatus TaxID=409849 RepID=A0A3B4BCJ6_9GOBI